ncbi:conserved Plasmodium protein, unknown function [Plasmodium sp. gorilla clade G2]|uniref:conserved Plasmodium protein, unknown function n=1 Tax=Plasmodium sp. gorilla clade G2 TaxID=880535 RepID=UPI000D21BE69|nr:conserved Plasmodium protein, unknown function [Plasmodium sp. gorilla clade G2]SOV18659.1 conserved Plasmodium protein, unknown function [Plasmodium sp. gorilla clade G2]
MKRYFLHNDKCCNRKKAKIECEFNNELKKECLTPNIYDYQSNIKNVEAEKDDISVGGFNLFNLEENGKRRKINILNIFDNNIKKKNETDIKYINHQNNNNHFVGNKNDEKVSQYNDYDTRNENFNYYMNEHIHRKNIYKSKDKFDNDNFSYDKMEYLGKEKWTSIKNKYYIKINNLLKDMHMIKLARNNDKMKM